MPDMSGYEVCTRLKADPRTSPIPVIFVSALCESDDECQGLSVGAIDYITKPVAAPILLARVKNHLEMKKYRDILENLSMRDGLTSVPNRRHFDNYYQHEWRRALRSGEPLGMILIDIDMFKQYNDTYGHLAGDDCLKKIAQALADGLKRPADLLARYGGEEFICLLPDTELTGALAVAEQLRHNVAACNLSHASSTVSTHVTVSMGVVSLVPTAETNPDDLIRQVDILLYAAKKAGRNQIKCSV